MTRNKVKESIQFALSTCSIETNTIELSHPTNPDHGDYASSIAMKYAKELKTNPMDLAQKIATAIPKNNLIDRVEVIKPGFINIHLSSHHLVSESLKLAQKDFKVDSLFEKKNMKVLVEFAHPNTHKLFHIGHLLNITIGETLSRSLAASGYDVIRANYQGDVGMHIAKCLWRLMQIKDDDQTKKIFNSSNVSEKITLLGRVYAEGSKAYEEDENAKNAIHEVNKKIYAEDPEIKKLWEETRLWSLEYFNAIYKRVGSHFDRFYFEHEMAKRGVDIVNEALKKGVLEKSDGAVIFNGKPHGMDTRVFLNALGLPTYEGKELALAEKEFSEFGELSKAIHVVGPEQSSFFKITFKVEELLDEKKYKGKQHHLAYGWVRLKHGKMSSRQGKVVEGMWLFDEVKKLIIGKFKCDDQTAEKIALASIKYSFLKSDIKHDLIFDFEKSIEVEGNSGPYMLYTVVRAKSVLAKAGSFNDVSRGGELNKEEITLIRHLYKFPEAIEQAAEHYLPSTLATYLFQLAQQFNLFYQSSPVLKAEGKTKDFRLVLTQAVVNVLTSGLHLLGIETVEKM